MILGCLYLYIKATNEEDNEDTISVNGLITTIINIIKQSSFTFTLIYQYIMKYIGQDDSIFNVNLLRERLIRMINE
ncbi:hypothetical protein CANARDRAFT_30291 [[Candida] arabinofermentans NRRL YB-2248]|uniref:Uncharacterized protein n=1 Tax=[Candida] arabinofermentans NRRL YB-2248 TaxID=983967 RepID=A0A1E4SU77_9ASCO|nr:hypothetical protein CANARDRAFT_30291 [[Candida] arabinofermentans NRRL YB-2248]